MNPKLTCLAIAALLFTASYAQKIQAKDLAGTWLSIKTSKNDPSIKLKFVDSTHFTMTMNGALLMNCSYTIDNSSAAVTKLFFTGTAGGTGSYDDVWLVKKLGADTLKFQSQKFLDPTGSKHLKLEHWDNKETSENTGSAVRIKE